MASYLYYQRDQAFISDGDFDSLCKLLADNWERIPPEYQTQLGSADQIRTSGFHCKYSNMCIAAAEQWLDDGAVLYTIQIGQAFYTEEMEDEQNYSF